MSLGVRLISLTVLLRTWEQIVPKLASVVEGLMKSKERLLAKLESRLSPQEVEEARKDGHAQREPLPCGLTVHTGWGCSFGCVYCYVPDMGFDMTPRPYKLSGLQLVYAILSNPYFVPGESGTLLAFGSVTEPFMPVTKDRALEYLDHVRRYLRNPTQIATKAKLEEGDVEALKKVAEPNISILVTVITLDLHKLLEPGAPTPDERFETMRRLVERGFKVTLFLRPIIPGLTDREAPKILARAKESGVRSAVVGSLRVTLGILERLKAVGIDVERIVARLPRPPRNPRDQVALDEADVKRVVARVASRLGIKAYYSSCAANIEAHGLTCWACKWGPCGELERLPKVSEDDIREALEVFELRASSIKVKGNTILVRPKERGRAKKWSVAKHWLATLTRRKIIVST